MIVTRLVFFLFFFLEARKNKLPAFFSIHEFDESSCLADNPNLLIPLRFLFLRLF